MPAPCCFTRDLFSDPVIAMECLKGSVHATSACTVASLFCFAGHTYERAATQDWLNRCSLPTGFETNEVLPSKMLMSKFTTLHSHWHSWTDMAAYCCFSHRQGHQLLPLPALQESSFTHSCFCKVLVNGA